jgi:hypothetical protein
MRLGVDGRIKQMRNLFPVFVIAKELIDPGYPTMTNLALLARVTPQIIKQFYRGELRDRDLVQRIRAVAIANDYPVATDAS